MSVINPSSRLAWWFQQHRCPSSFGPRAFSIFCCSHRFWESASARSHRSNALVADLVKDRRLGAAMGVFGTIWDVGESAGPILAGFLIAQMSYSASFDVIALLMVVAAVILALVVRDPTKSAEDT